MRTCDACACQSLESRTATFSLAIVEAGSDLPKAPPPINITLCAQCSVSLIAVVQGFPQTIAMLSALEGAMIEERGLDS